MYNIVNLFMKNKRIAHFGTFDVDNYGDLLFPYIAEFRLPKLDWYHISPSNRKTIFEDGKEIISFNESIKNNYEAVITGGGNIIHLFPNKNTVYAKYDGFEYANLWVGASKLAANQRIPHIFNGPGISVKFNDFIHKEIAARTFRMATYVGLREVYSKRLAQDALNSGECETLEIIPDTAFDICNMWPIETIAKENFIAVNLNARYHNPINETSEYLGEISKKLSMPIKFVVIGACHGDYEFTKKVARNLNVRNQIMESKSLKEIAHVIGKAQFFFGSSMHGFITALSYNTPAFIVLKKSPMHKFKGLLELIELDESSIRSSFKETFFDLDSWIVLPDEIRSGLNQKLDIHWKKVEEIINKGGITRKDYFINNYKFLLRTNLKKHTRILKKISTIFK